MNSLQISVVIVTCIYFASKADLVELTVCYDNSSNLETINNGPRVVDVTIGSTVYIWCHYCNSKEDFDPKLWFYSPRGKLFQKQLLNEIQINEDTTDNLSVTLSHTLKLNYFNPNNSGVYTCNNCNSNIGNNFTYVLDGVVYVKITPKVGGISQYREFKRVYIDSVNKKFKMSEEEPYSAFRSHYKIILNVYTAWDTWSECKPIDGHQKGIRKRLGRCRIGPAENVTMKIILRNDSSNSAISYLTDEYDIPCRSLKLNELLPEISRISRNIPYFEAEEICAIFPKSAKRNKKKSKSKTIQEVMENSHVTLMCTEVIPNSDLKWFKDKQLLKSLYGNILNMREDEPHLTIDTNNSLHILHISKNEEGNYTCSMNGKRVKQFEVKVVSKSKLLNQEFFRYSIYLGFVLSLTMTYYCAGVCVAWHRRASFADPLNLYKKKPYARSNCKEEHLLG